MNFTPDALILTTAKQGYGFEINNDRFLKGYTADKPRTTKEERDTIYKDYKNGVRHVGANYYNFNYWDRTPGFVS